MKLSPAQVRNRLILDARVIITDHWPRADVRDWCPICHWEWPCLPTRTAYAYLACVGAHLWVPPRVRLTAVGR